MAQRKKKDVKEAVTRDADPVSADVGMEEQSVPTIEYWGLLPQTGEILPETDAQIVTAEQLIDILGSKSMAIRWLAGDDHAGTLDVSGSPTWPRAQIAQFLSCRYQQVRNVLTFKFKRGPRKMAFQKTEESETQNED